MIEFLDIDMDFFIDDIAHWVDKSKNRLDKKSYFPMNEKEVVEFLESKLGLSKNKKIPGRIITNHNEAFYFWRELIIQGILKVPFNIVHVDAHADLGLGYASYVSIFSDVLALPIEERSKIENYPSDFPKPDIGDYLLFALACRWVSSLTYVVHPCGQGDDFVSLILERNGKTESRIRIRERNYEKIEYSIQLPCGNKKSLESMIFGGNEEGFYNNAKFEPHLPFTVTRDYEHIKPDQGFDYLVFCTSPNYTPDTADFIIDIIREYIHII